MSVFSALSELIARLFKTAPAVPPAPVQVQQPLQPVAVPPAIPPAPNPLSPQQASAILAIWASTGSVEVTLDTGTLLWHGGTVATAAGLINTNSLWCTKDPSQATHYDGWAIEDAKRKGVTAHRLELALVRPLKMADFGYSSLLQFTANHCKGSHDAMKTALRAWCLQRGFDGAVNLNSNESEVVVCTPGVDLSLVSSTQLWP